MGIIKDLRKSEARMLYIIDKHWQEDGGAGSGNWGHKGRPGKKGGSGKGGGKKYRSEKEVGGYEQKKLDPLEVAKKHMNTGSASLSRSGNGEKFAPNKSKSASKFSEKLNRVDPMAVYQSNSAKELWMNDPDTCMGMSMDELKEFFDEAKAMQKKSGYTPTVIDDGKVKPYYKPNPVGEKADMPTKVSKVPQASDVKFTFERGKNFVAEAGQNGEVRINLDKIDSIGDHVLSHEFAHQISANNPELAKAILANPGNLFGSFVTFTDGDSGFINGASYTPEESFAEAFAMYHNKDNSIMQEQFPDLYEYMDKLMKDNPEIEEQLHNYMQNAYEAINESNSYKESSFTYSSNSDIIKNRAKKSVKISSSEKSKLYKHAMLYMTKEQREEPISSISMGGYIYTFEHDRDYNITRIISKKRFKVMHD